MFSPQGRSSTAFQEMLPSFSCKLGMSATTVIPIIHASENGIHKCARCSGPATTCCSRCKAVRYCSGECQIIHWRQGHKHECQQLETNSRISSPVAAYTSIDTIGIPIMERRSINERVSIKSKLRKEDGAVLHSIKGASRKEVYMKHMVLIHS